MSRLLRFLKSLNQGGDEFFEIRGLSQENNAYRTLNDLFKSFDFKKTEILKAKPNVRKGQIWLIETSYYDFWGTLNTANNPFLVLLSSSPEELEGESFLRVQPISPFVEFSGEDDYVISDPSIVGFPFLVETWNEQPILNEILGYCIATINTEELFINKSNSEIELTKEQIEFRELEVEATEYLRTSILQYLRFLELRQTSDTGVVISIGDDIYQPKLFINDVASEASYAIAAKTGIDKSNKYFEFETKSDTERIKIRIKRNVEDFVLSVYSNEDFILKDREGKTQSCTKADDRSIFPGLLGGFYILESSNIQAQIKIRIK